MQARMGRTQAGTIEATQAGLACADAGTVRWPEDAVLAVINPLTLDAIRQLEHYGSPGLVQRVVGIFLDETPRLIDGLHRAVRESAADRLRLGAHSLKGSSGNVGAERLNACARRLERACKGGFPANADTLIAAIDSSFEEAARALRRLA